MKKEMISNLGVSALCESMMMMLRAGIQTDEAISLLLEDNRGSGVLTEALRKADELVAMGQTVSQAFRETGVFPDYMVRMIAMGERSGQLETVFGHLAEYYAQQDSISQQLWSVVRYPAVMLVVILAVLAVMIGEGGGALGAEGEMVLWLAVNGWDYRMALCAMVFCLFHWPCSTTVLTIRKETESRKWTLLAVLLPTVIGLLFCRLIAVL